MSLVSLMYHDVVDPDRATASGFPSADAALYKVAPAVFEAHLRAVGATGALRVAPPAEALPRHGVLLHFDDGGASALPETADLLERHGWRGIFHVTTGRIGSPGFVTEADLRELARRGHGIGSHSCSHPPRMSELPEHEIRREWKESLARLEQLLGQQVPFASVPGGFTSRQVERLAAEEGVRFLFTSEPCTCVRKEGTCAVLGRYAVRRDTSAVEAAAMARGDLVPRYRQWAVWQLKKPLKRLGGERWLRLRARLLARR
ncbi:MAG: polysaccharide deacetylase family protein [Deltaproteobacteria bacterium]|nr:polysaccharide deacetylase family protein [Deltaproteobacteria bacterium]